MKPASIKNETIIEVNPINQTVASGIKNFFNFSIFIKSFLFLDKISEAINKRVNPIVILMIKIPKSEKGNNCGNILNMCVVYQKTL